MAALEIEVTVDKALTNLDRAKKGLADLGAQAKQTEAQTRNVGAGLNSAFQATSGGIGIATGIAQTAQSLSQLNTSAAAFSSARTLLEIGKTVQDFRELRTAVGGAGGALSALSALWRASPLGVAATVISAIGGIASAISSIGAAASRSAAGVSELGAAMREAKLSRQAAADLGLPDPGVNPQIDALRKSYEKLRGDGTKGIGAGATADALGISQIDVVRYLASRGNADATDYLRTGAYGLGYPNLPPWLRAQGGIKDPSQIGVAGADIEAIYRARVADLQRQNAPINSVGGDFWTNQNVGVGARNFSQMQAIRGGSFTPGPNLEELAQEAERRKQMLEQQRDQWLEIRGYVVDISQTLGGAFANALTGAQSLRQAMASVLQQLAQTGITKAAGALGGALFENFNPAPPGVGTGDT